jgi:hypothetical protein
VTAPDIFLAALLRFAGFLSVPTDDLRHLTAPGAKVAAVPPSPPRPRGNRTSDDHR